MKNGNTKEWPDSQDRYPRGRFARYRQVARILARHGFGWMLGQLGLRRLLPFHLTIPGRRPVPQHTAAEHLRLAIEELGTTFIKMGQILSTRSDLLPPAYVVELSRLQDAVPPEPAEVIEAQIARELGLPPGELFAEFDRKPIGSASIGQVHAARLKTGEEVVVKVQRPGVEALVEEDLAILRDLARMASRRTIWGQIYDLPGMVEEFSATLMGETDYLREGRNADRIRRSFADEPRLRVPNIYWDYTTKRVLTMERLRGAKIDDLSALDKAGIDRKALAKDGARIVLKMVMEDGFYHADPHPGNFVVMEGGIIGLLDYGMVGQVDENTRDGLLYLLVAVANQDLDRIIDQLIDLGVVGTAAQLQQLRRDLGHLLATYWGIPLKDVNVAGVLEESMGIARRHLLQLPNNLVLLAKSMAMNEGLTCALDPDFSTAETLKPYALRLAWERYMPQQWGKRLIPTLADLSRLAITLPRRTERLLNRMERGELALQMRVQETEHILEVLNRIANRLVLGMLVSGFAVALALLIQVYYAGELRWLQGWILAAGMAVVGGLGLWLTANLLRGGH